MKIQLSGVAETLFIPLRIRAYETKRSDALLQDPYAVDILEKIDFEESSKDNIFAGSQIGTIIRTQLLDVIVREFTTKYPDAVVINLGCGLDARYKRLNIQNIQWFDIDIEETMNVRRQFFKDEENYKMIPKSMFDYTWMNDVPSNKPTLILLEGVTMYFSEDELRALFKEIFKRFTYVEMAFDVLASAKKISWHPDLRKYNAPFKWGLANINDLKKWDGNIGLISDQSYMVSHHLKRWPLVLRIVRYFYPCIKNMCRVEHIRKVSQIS